jgi:uncharacterized protein YhfF
MLERFWTACCAATGLHRPRPGTTQFGDTPSQQDELCALVLAGQKRATASLLRWYGVEPMPAIGDVSIVLDSSATPRAVIQTVSVVTAPFHAATAEFAALEGEGDSSLAYWQAEHRRYFTSELAKDGEIFAEDELVVFEVFRLLWFSA